uniref:ARAD1D35398p n=1 Tax=Blastobotrys adeninivorans TaxID=409370 RepID=A0A060TBI1_BLAAD
MSEEITLNPKPGFVIKTVIASGKRQGTKTFINLCVDDQVPEPNVQSYDDVSVSPDDFVVPIVLSQERETIDKAGRKSLVRDCCVNPRVVDNSLKNARFRLMVIETCLELVGNSSDEVLSREFSLPKMQFKESLEKTVIRRQDLEPQGTSVSGVTSQLDELAGQVLREKSTPQPDKSVDKSIGNSKSLIQVVDEDVPMEEPTEEPLEDDRINYKTTRYDSSLYSGEGQPPRFKVEITGIEQSKAEGLTIGLDKIQRRIRCMSLDIPVPAVADKVEAYYARDTSVLTLFVY